MPPKASTEASPDDPAPFGSPVMDQHVFYHLMLNRSTSLKAASATPNRSVGAAKPGRGRTRIVSGSGAKVGYPTGC